MKGLIVVIAIAVFFSGCSNLGHHSTGSIGREIKTAVTSYKVTGKRLHTAAELKTAYDERGGDSDQAVLLFMNALLLLEENPTDGKAAAAYMCRPEDRREDMRSPTGCLPVPMREQGEFMRLFDNKYIARSYVGGDGVNYELADPEKVEISVKEHMDAGEGKRRYFLYSTGKDSASPMAVRKEGERWVMDEWSSITTGVRK